MKKRLEVIVCLLLAVASVRPAAGEEIYLPAAGGDTLLTAGTGGILCRTAAPARVERLGPEGEVIWTRPLGRELAAAGIEAPGWIRIGALAEDPATRDLLVAGELGTAADPGSCESAAVADAAVDAFVLRFTAAGSLFAGALLDGPSETVLSPRGIVVSPRGDVMISGISRASGAASGTASSGVFVEIRDSSLELLEETRILFPLSPFPPWQGRGESQRRSPSVRIPDDPGEGRLGHGHGSPGQGP